MRARLQLDPLRGIHVDAIHVKNPMKVRTRRPTGGASVTKNIAALHRRAASNNQACHVQVRGLEALSVVDADCIAKNVELFSKGDSTSRDGANWLAFGSALVYAAVIFAGGFAVVE